MSTTTMDAATQASASATKETAAMIKRLAQPAREMFGRVWGVGRWIFHFDIGAAALVGEQTARFVNAAVAKGKEVEPALMKPFRKAGDSVSEALGEMGTHLKEIAKPAHAPRHARSQSGQSRRTRAARTA